MCNYSDPEVSSEEAAKHLRSKVDPVYSPTAKQLRLQGDVVLRIAISEAGAVKLRAIESGSPLLSSSAIDAVTKWKYSPFLVAGKPVTVETVITIPFSLGDSPERIKQLTEINNRYFEAFDLCHKQRIDNQLSQAEANCKNAVALADQLDPVRRLERVNAFAETGNTLFLQRRFADALEYYQKEPALAETFLTVEDNDLARAHALLATVSGERAAQRKPRRNTPKQKMVTGKPVSILSPLSSKTNIPGD